MFSISLDTLAEKTTSGKVETFKTFARNAGIDLRIKPSKVGSGVYGVAVKGPSSGAIPTVMKIVPLKTPGIEVPAATQDMASISEFVKELAITRRLAGMKGFVQLRFSAIIRGKLPRQYRHLKEEYLDRQPEPDDQTYSILVLADADESLHHYLMRRIKELPVTYKGEKEAAIEASVPSLNLPTTSYR